MKIVYSSLLLLFLTIGLWAQERGLGNPKTVYIEKGTLAAGISGSYRGWDTKDGMSLMGIVTDTDGSLTYGVVDAHAAWFFMDNTSLVVTAGYTNTAFDGNSAKVAGIMDLSNKHLRREKYSASIGARRYQPLFNSKILAMFGEGRITGSRGYSKNYSITDRGKEGSYTDLYSVSFDVLAGISVFVTNQLALQAKLPVASFGYEWKKQTEALVKDSSYSGLKLSSQTDFLGISIGTVYHF